MLTDIFLYGGVPVTLLLGILNLIYNLRNNRRTTFINSVTAERVKWINSLRANISDFAGLVFNFLVTYPEDPNALDPEDEKMFSEMFKQTDRLRMLIKLQLNPKGTHDAQIENIVDTLYLKNKGLGRDRGLALLKELMQKSRKLLKEEWDKVKEEAKRGDLNDSWRLKMRKFF